MTIKQIFNNKYLSNKRKVELLTQRGFMFYSIKDFFPESHFEHRFVCSINNRKLNKTIYLNIATELDLFELNSLESNLYSDIVELELSPKIIKCFKMLYEEIVPKRIVLTEKIIHGRS
jgi:hypothetical protein